MADGDNATVLELSEERCLTDYPLPSDCASAVKKARRKAKKPDSGRRRWRIFSSKREEEPTGEQETAVEEDVCSEEEAAVACKQIVSIEGQDVTLKQLVAMVAEQVGVNAVWEAERLVVSAKE